MKLLSLALALFLALPAIAADARKPAAYTPKELDKLWRNVGGKEQKWVTSNSIHFWAWARNEGEGLLGGLLQPQGQVIGDPHLKNVFDYRAGRAKARLAVADIDDGGKGPLVLDFVRYVTYLEASDLETKVGVLFKAYLEGLKGRDVEESSLLEEARAETAATIEGLHTRYVNKYVSGDQFDYGGLGLIPVSRMSRGQKEELEAITGVVLKKSGYEKVWDRGFRMNDSGSSAGLGRFWFLLGSNAKPTRILEAKELDRPALDYYEPQGPAPARVAAVVKAYSEDGFDPTLFGVISGAGKNYWLRPRKYQALDLDDKHSPAEKRAFADVVAQWIGARQRAQAGGAELLRMLEKDPARAKDAVERTVRAYQAEMDRLGR